MQIFCLLWVMSTTYFQPGQSRLTEPQAHDARSYYFFNFYTNVQHVKRDIFTADIYYYKRPSPITRNVTFALQHMEVLCYNALNLLLVFNVTPFKIDRNKNKNRSIEKGLGIWEKKEGKYAKPLAKIQVTAIFQDMQRNVLCMETGWVPTWRPETNRNICHLVLLQKREIISRGTQKQ